MSDAPKKKPLNPAIVQGPLTAAVWMLAWPSVLQNVIGGLQGLIDHALVGHLVGYQANAAIGVSLQIHLVVIIFVISLYSGMAVLVARHAGAGETELVNRAVYQGFLATVIISIGVLAPVGWVLSPWLLTLVKAAPEVQAEALPYLRTMFVGSFAMLTFFMFGGALRAVGDAKTPLRLGVAMTLLNVCFNIILIRGLGPIPALGTMGSALGTVLAGSVVGVVGFWLLGTGRLPIHWKRGMSWAPDWQVIRELLRFGIPSGLQGVAMNIAGVLLLRFMGSLEQSAAAQAAYAVGYSELFSFITWPAVGLMGAVAAVVGQNLGANQPERSMAAVRVGARYAVTIAVVVGVLFLTIPHWLFGLFGLTDPVVLRVGTGLLAWLSVSGLFVSLALVHTGGLQGAGDTKSPLYISIVSQIMIPLGLCTLLQSVRPLQPTDIWLAILLGHITRSALSVLRFRQGKWRGIVVRA